ncbi:hypothetical protein ACTFIT_003270 [Dictyostelium discoideum]
MSEEESNKIEAEIKRLFDSGVFEENQIWERERVLFDYRGVNKQTEDFALDILKSTKNCKYFSVVDAKSGFHLLQVKEEHINFTAFSFKGKLYQFRREPFGMKNSPAYFNKWIQSIIEEFKDFARAYVDDIIIFSKTLDDHITHVNTVQGYCQFLWSYKVEAIYNLPITTTVTEIRSFLGSCNYLRRFISNYSELTARLTALTAKPDFTKSFDVYIDASDIGSCCVIMQDVGNGNIRPILYESCRFNKFQRNSSTTDREF